VDELHGTLDRSQPPREALQHTFAYALAEIRRQVPSSPLDGVGVERSELIVIGQAEKSALIFSQVIDEPDASKGSLLNLESEKLTVEQDTVAIENHGADG
jgi:hypothetical protein